ncbi:hypothetical protein RJ640_008401 [Escallonia rubra]|uniref:Exocyst subunit Exo70 family protein n=1 Tax=Escallonia rubra TaxID=112253 RepID=A0AA88ULC3_9ASTE|nr:hypothetical protein RJ640_008401 [Escallonia rubra]
MELEEIVTAFKSAMDRILGYSCPPSDSTMQPGERMIFDGGRHEIDQYFKAVDELQKSIMPSDYQIEVKSLIQTAMARLKFEFQAILARLTDIDPNDADYISSNSSSVPEYEGVCSYPHYEMEVYYLRNIAERMNLEGHLAYCAVAYRNSRRIIVDSCLRLRLGTKKFSTKDIQRMEWDVLQKEIKQWITSSSTCFQILFGTERLLFDDIFQGDLGTAVYDECFVGITKDAAVQFIKFAEDVCTTRPSMQKLFEMLDLYNAVLHLLSDVNYFFHSKSGECIRTRAAELLPQLADLIRASLLDFENGVLHELSDPPISTGTTDSLTWYVSDYITRILQHEETLSKLVVSNPLINSTKCEDGIQFLEGKDRSPLELHLVWILASLKLNLKGKYKHYKDVSLGHLSMMNNIFFIVRRIKQYPELQEMIGKDYLDKLDETVLQEANSYLVSTWDRIVYCLRDKGLHHAFGFYKGVSRSSVRGRFKAFNATFEELRKQLQNLILEKLVPAYRSFLERFKSHVESGNHPEKYIKYSVEDLRDAVDGLFVEYQLCNALKSTSQ